MIRFEARTRRRLLAGLLLVAVLPVSFLREALPVPDKSQRIEITALPVPSAAETRPHLGPFHLDAIWQIASANPMFGSYSTLMRLRDGQFLTISDRGYALRFSAPDEPQRSMEMVDIVGTTRHDKADRDAESSAYDPTTGTVWIGWEGSNAITRHGQGLRLQSRAHPAAMRDWSYNSGAEAMLRLADGRFLVLAEEFSGRFETRRHPALLFPGDPTGPGAPVRLELSASQRFSPTDMAQLPDGRVLIVMRRAVWPMPFRFVGRLVLADPAEIRPGKVWTARDVAYLSSSLPVDNFEGIVIDPRPDGKVTVWLISDDNIAATQRTLLWKMTVDPKELR